ncbi:MAG: nucleotidyltransferase domain-containing protein, partial [Chloroflexota bacterium]
TMPVRSFNSPVLKRPDRQTVDRAVREWAAALGQERPGVVAVGCFRWYARGDWGVGSDVDLVVILASSPFPFERRSAELDASLTIAPSVATALPVPADLLVCTYEEWQRLTQHTAGGRLGQEVVWVYGRLPESRPAGATKPEEQGQRER